MKHLFAAFVYRIGSPGLQVRVSKRRLHAAAMVLPHD